jgi:hypothetical protein
MKVQVINNCYYVDNTQISDFTITMVSAQSYLIDNGKVLKYIYLNSFKLRHFCVRTLQEGFFHFYGTQEHLNCIEGMVKQPFSLHDPLISIGFKKNRSIINGYVPHYKRGNDILFLIGGDYVCRKIVGISRAYEHSEFNVFGVLTVMAPRSADRDWITSHLKLLFLNPISVAQWRWDGSGLEFIKKETI